MIGSSPMTHAQGRMISVRASTGGLGESAARRQLLGDYLTAFIGSQRLPASSASFVEEVARQVRELLDRLAEAPRAARVQIEVVLDGASLRIDVHLQPGWSESRRIAL